jgi:hypothetical protein
MLAAAYLSQRHAYPSNHLWSKLSTWDASAVNRTVQRFADLGRRLDNGAFGPPNKHDRRRVALVTAASLPLIVLAVLVPGIGLLVFVGFGVVAVVQIVVRRRHDNTR